MKKSNDKIRSIAVDGIESIIDALPYDEVIKKIPVINSLLATKEAYMIIQNHWFIKKLNKYLSTPYYANKDEIDSFLSEISEVDHEKINDIIVHLLSSSEDPLKAVYLKRLIDATIRKICTIEQAGYISFIMQSIYALDLEKICDELAGNSTNDGGFKERLHTLDILERDVELKRDFQNDPENVGIKYRMTNIGVLFVKCIFPERYKLFEERLKKDAAIFQEIFS